MSSYHISLKKHSFAIHRFKKTKTYSCRRYTQNFMPTRLFLFKKLK